MKLFSQTREQLFTQSTDRFFVNFCSVLILLATTFGASAQSVTFAWDSMSGVSGYRLYQGGTSRVYTNWVDSGSATQATISGLTVGKTYYFAATAYNSSGIESDYSSEVAYTVPASTNPVITLTSPTAGATYSSPATIHLAANTVANGHTITKVQFLSNGAVAKEVTVAPYTTDLSNVSAGSYSFSARLVYDGALTLDTPAVGVTVTAGRPPGNPLTFNADSGTLTAPFIAVNGIVSQSLQTSLTGSGEAVYNFPIDLSGKYVVSALLNAPSTGENSVYINVDGEPTDPLMIWDIPVTTGFTNQIASWRGNGSATGPPQFSPKVFNLKAGTHQLYVRGREANVQLQSFSIVPAGALMRLTMLTGNKKAGLTGLGQSGHIYEVQASRDLKTWSVLGNVTADSTGAFSYTDTTAASFTYQYYRLRDTTP